MKREGCGCTPHSCVVADRFSGSISRPAELGDAILGDSGVA
jgi:hypothetical protein